jgi:ribosome-associated protein
MITINERLSIPLEELTFLTGPSSGPGGQNVNKVSTRVTLHFNVALSPSLNEHQRALLSAKLANRINDEGFLRVVCQVHRTQGANREEVVVRFASLLRSALTERKPRRETKPSRGAIEQRLEQKRRLSATKRDRSSSRNKNIDYD